MPGENNVLVICREPGDLALVDQFRGGSQGFVVVASDNVDVAKAAGKRPWVSKVCFIEQMETPYIVADDVLRIRAILNQWMASLAAGGEGVPQELLLFELQVEGGMTTQRIQDALLLMRSYAHLFGENNVSRVVLRRHIGTRWEDDVLVQTARSRGVEVEEHKAIGYRIGARLNLLVLDRYLFGSIRRVYLPLGLIYLIRLTKLYVSVVRAKLHAHNRSAEGDGPSQIAFLLGASSDKHVYNIVPLMMEFQRRGTYQPVALCWRAAKGAAKVRSQGLSAIEFEAWFPLSRIWEVWQRVRRTRLRALRRKDELQRDSTLSYEGVALASLMQPSLDYLLGFRVYERLFLRLAAERYFQKHRPVAMKTWGDSMIDLGAICRDVVQRVCKPPSLIFHYSIGIGLDWPYSAHNSDLYLAADRLEKHFLIRHGAAPSSVVVTGQARYDHLTSFQQKYSKDDSRQLLGLPLTGQLYAFYVLGYPIRGVESSREFYTAASSVLAFFREGTHGVLIIKPHPSDSANTYGGLKRSYPTSDTIFWYDKGMVPYHCVNAADLVITKMSTVGVESILLGVPLVSIALDGERRFQEMYGDVPERFESIEELLSFLKSLGEDPKAIDALTQKQFVLQQRFLKERLVGHDRPAAETMADVLEERVGRHVKLSS